MLRIRRRCVLGKSIQKLLTVSLQIIVTYCEHCDKLQEFILNSGHQLLIEDYTLQTFLNSIFIIIEIPFLPCGILLMVLVYIMFQQISFKNLVERNRRVENKCGPPAANSAIQLPFIIVNTSRKTVIDCSISNDK